MMKNFKNDKKKRRYVLSTLFYPETFRFMSYDFFLYQFKNNLNLCNSSFKTSYDNKKPETYLSVIFGTIHLRRRHVLGGEGGSPLPMFADARGIGVLGLPTSAIFGHILT